MSNKETEQPEEEIKDEATEQETVEENAGETAEETAENPAGDASGEGDEEEVPVEIDWKDKYTRLYSEFDNYRKRSNREKIDIIKNASGQVMKDLLPVLDDFNRAIKANEDNIDNETLDSLKEGFKLIHHKLKTNLEKNGLKSMDSIGKPFDVDHHEAITEIPAPSDDMKGKVVDAVETGYFLNDKVLRYAKVVVGK